MKLRKLAAWICGLAAFGAGVTILWAGPQSARETGQLGSKGASCAAEIIKLRTEVEMLRFDYELQRDGVLEELKIERGLRMAGGMIGLGVSLQNAINGTGVKPPKGGGANSNPSGTGSRQRRPQRTPRRRRRIQRRRKRRSSRTKKRSWLGSLASCRRSAWTSRTLSASTTRILVEGFMRLPVLIFDFGNVVGYFDYLRACERFAGGLAMTARPSATSSTTRFCPTAGREFESGQLTRGSLRLARDGDVRHPAQLRRISSATGRTSSGRTSRGALDRVLEVERICDLPGFEYECPSRRPITAASSPGRWTSSTGSSCPMKSAT